MTLKQYITLFSDFATRHEIIQSFDFGRVPDWMVSNKQDNENLIYPAMFVAPLGTALNESGELTRRFRVFFCERERKAGENENDGWSDCERLWLDFIAYMTKSTNDYATKLDSNLSAEPYAEWEVDFLVAYIGDFSFRESFEFNECIVPIT